VGSQQVFDLVLRIGTVSHKVEVSTDAPAIQTTSSEISATVNATTVRELPLNGRSWTDLAALQPGVDTIQTQPTFAVGADRGNRGFGQQLTISGARPQQNNYRLDGASINDYANGAPGSVLGGNLGVGLPSRNFQSSRAIIPQSTARLPEASSMPLHALEPMDCMGVSTNFSGTAHSTQEFLRWCQNPFF